MKKRMFVKGMKYACLLALIGLFSGCVTKGYHEKVVSTLKREHRLALIDRARRMEAQEKALRSKNSAILAELLNLKSRCQNNLAKLTNKNIQRARRLKSALNYIQNLETKLNSWRDLHARLLKSFSIKIKEGTLAVKFERGKIILRMPEKVLFETSSANIKEDGKQMIKEVAAVLANEPYNWQVAGHADSRGSAEFNWALSYQRAMAVLKVMLKSEMPAKQLSAAAYGHYRPRASNETTEGRALNRRTEIVFIPQLKALLVEQAKEKLTGVCVPTNKRKS